MAPPPEDPVRARARAIVAGLDLEAKVRQLSGDLRVSRDLLPMARRYNGRPYPSGADPEHGIAAFWFTDGPRGVAAGASTCFPAAIGRGATWDPELEERVGDAIGVEARVAGATLWGGVCVNLLRHPGWGRAQETYGEDPVLLGAMGAAAVRGAQRHVMACVKHFALNSIEEARFRVDVRVDERVLHEVYLPHFRQIVDAGVASVMSAYNQVEGQWCGHSTLLLRDILKGEWGFGGFVMSDFVMGLRDARAGALGGLDVEMPFRARYARSLPGLVARGEVPVSVVDEAAERVVAAKLRFADVGEPVRYTRDAVAGPAHRSLAREVAARSMVLLRNEDVGGGPLLPVDPARVRSIALVGPLAEVASLGDHGSSQVRPPHAVTPSEGLRAALPAGVELRVARGLRESVAAARACDAVVAVVGLTWRDEGEWIGPIGGDRRSLRLPPEQESLLRALAAVNPRVVAVVIAGGPVVMESWRERVPGLLMAWYPGMEGGHALAEVLLGAAEPGGRLPAEFPVSEFGLPEFDPRARSVRYDRWHGYRLRDHGGPPAAYPFGFGLGYTRWEYGPPTATRVEGGLRVEVEVVNTGDRCGATVVQAYVGQDAPALEREVRRLGAFRRVEANAGEGVRVALDIPEMVLQSRDSGRWVLPEGPWRVEVGGSSDPADLTAVLVD